LRANAAHPYVSRGGVKLAAALDHFHLDPKGRVCLDVGASTGGFTHVLVNRGARRIYAVDVGHGQLHDTMRARAEVNSLEATDIRSLSRAQFDELPDFVTDVSFILSNWRCRRDSACKVAQLIVLVKPHRSGPGAAKKASCAIQRSCAVCDDIVSSSRSVGACSDNHHREGSDGNAEFCRGRA
jgi:23S rRNA (cytidine1920-2'-O)/16S rRNA (cytidine1409-2'-O)-methyltransferase